MEPSEKPPPYVTDQSTPPLLSIVDLSAPKSSPPFTISSLRHVPLYHDEARRTQSGGRLIFIQGFIPTSWFPELSAKFNVNFHDIYNRHLNSLLPSADHFFTLTLPSNTKDVICLRILTGLSWNDSTGHGTLDAKTTTAQLRASSATHMRGYIEELFGHDLENISPGDSIIRRFAVHDKNHFSTDQVVTVQVKPDQPGWLAFLWLDQGHTGRFPSSIPHRKLEKEAGSELHAITVGQTTNPATYGRTLNRALMAQDAFYAMEEIFRLAIESENQFLSMLLSRMHEAIQANNEADLRYTHTIIEDHIKFILSESRHGIKEDFKHLTTVAESIREQCIAEISRIKGRKNAPSKYQTLTVGILKGVLLEFEKLQLVILPISCAVSLSLLYLFSGWIRNWVLRFWVWVVFEVFVLAAYGVRSSENADRTEAMRLGEWLRQKVDKMAGGVAKPKGTRRG
ncbi:hypothetical protein QBC44DRAFT_313185 [Cladorrhinum sp. PSN332]|nr:hypothetical protein QBC44DRAFT_313185 [Cladorrhinum sp. PSN332]